MATTAGKGMTAEEALFFKEAKLPVRLAAAAYASSRDFSKEIPILDSSGKTKEICSHAWPPPEHPDEFEGLANWNLNSRVHIAIIPVELPSSASATDAALTWDLALVFRGTQPYSIINWVTDFTFDKEPVENYILPNIQQEMRVHTGFQQAFMGLIPRAGPDGKDPTVHFIKGVIDKYIEEHSSPNQTSAQQREQTQDGTDGVQPLISPSLQAFRRHLASTMRAQPKPRRILSIGHSLGGALAVLGAAWCKTTLCNDKDFKNCPVQCITLGCPKVGNPAFAEAWDDLLQSKTGIDKMREGKSYRIVNGLDPVPSLPPSTTLFPACLQFQHVGMPVYLHREVREWNVKVWPFLGQERPLPNSCSPIDHVQWHYTAGMVVAEATVASATAKERESLDPHPSWWFVSFLEQLNLLFVYEEFKRTVKLDLPLHAHFWVLVLSWAAAAFSFVVGQAVCWLALFPLITLLFPAFTAALLVDCVIAAVVWPFKVCLGPNRNSIQSSPHYKVGNFSLALVSLVVMFITHVSAWLGL